MTNMLFFFTLLWLFVLGTVVGSFLNVCVHRFQRHDRLKDQLRSLAWPPSHCPRCQAAIRKGDNIPVIGWLRLRGRCRDCGLSISMRYPLVELCNGLLFALVYYLEIPHEWSTRIDQSTVFSPIGPQLVEGGLGDIALLHWRYAFHMVLFQALLVASLIDFDTMTIPDGSTVPAMIFAVIAATVFGQLWIVPVWFEAPTQIAGLVPDWMQNWFGPLFYPRPGPTPMASTPGQIWIPVWATTHPHWHGLAVSLVGLVVGGGLVWLVRIIGHLALRKEAMGFGDVVLMAMVGSFIGWQAAVVAFFVAPFFAMIAFLLRTIFRSGSEIAFGPYLSLGTVFVVLFWREIWPSVGTWFALGSVAVFAGVIMLAMVFPCLLLTRLVRYSLGFRDPEPVTEEVWEAADQLQYLAGEVVDRDRQTWKSSNSADITAAANGSLYTELWQDRGGPTGWSN